MNLLRFFGIICFFSLISPEVLANWRILSSAPFVYLPAGARFQELELESSDTHARVYAVLFSEKKCRLRILDNPFQRMKNLENALKGQNCFAGTNGAYFHNDFTPIGLVVSGGKVLHPMERARLLTGILEIREQSVHLIRSEQFRFSRHVVDALQAGPFLVEDGRKIRGLNDIRAARRTVIASDNRGTWALISTTPLTLAQVGDLLTTPDLFTRWRVWDALNLDGGSSTAFWADTKPTPVSIREVGVVRNFLGLTQKFAD